jgi:hypothetical protein
MVKQGANKVSTIKLPNGQFTQTRRDTLKELVRVHFPDSKVIDDSYDVCIMGGPFQPLHRDPQWFIVLYDSYDGQGHLNLGIYRRITNRGDWNLAKCVNQ